MSTKARKTGRFGIVEQLLADGITYMFGNPGTVEQGFLDAIGEYPRMRYITLCKRRSRSAMADGYARARRKPAVVQLHSSVGLGNGIGMMYQAKRGGAPLVVIAGESGVRYDAMDAQMAADLVSMAKPVTKWSTRVIDPASTLRVLRRAIKMAATAPTGPVFVALPMDVLDAELHRGGRADIVPGHPGCAQRGGGARGGRDAGRRLAAADHHRRRNRVLGRAGRADPRRRAARRRGVGRELLRGQHRGRPPALRRAVRAHVRRPQQQDHVAGRRGPDLRHVRVSRGVSGARRECSPRRRRWCTSSSTRTRSPRTSRSTSGLSLTRS